ncbi:alpha/beta hydrolase family protein [Actinorugispora endophytica]|uniref:Uncharacterized protein n=1 Tax=Actinorugispora endophytica TaxID=1605990 RepID=A0A4R6URI0_9ACTN|nr:alpha/beta fold hydrolase [Actinorugispora endophytica]TDQ48203.1 hypothetical protein EV190_11917 [Actinorugispora endophytica]
MPSLARALGAPAACAALLLSSACAGPEPATEPPAIAATEREVEFTSGPDTLFGTFAVPEGTTGRVPAALIISGSGPTDRDGNGPMRPYADTNLNFAAALADAGVASLRYDKLGSGETGMAGRSEGDPIGMGVFEEEMAAAYAELLAQPEVDPARLIVLGHSEGSLFALRAPEVVAGPAPGALILAAPVGERYLDVLDRQLTEQARLAESQGQLDAGEVNGFMSDSRASIARIRAGHDTGLDPENPLSGLFYPGVEPFLREIDRLDPVDLAAGLPEGTRTLMLWGTADSQVTGAEVDRLAAALDGVERVDVEDADHVFRETSTAPGAPVLDEDRPFSPEAAEAVSRFLADY